MLQLKRNTSVPFFEPRKRKITWQHPGRKMPPGGKQNGCRQQLPTTFASFKDSLYMGSEFKLWTLRHLRKGFVIFIVTWSINRTWLSDPQLRSWRELVGLVGLDPFGSQKKSDNLILIFSSVSQLLLCCLCKTLDLAYHSGDKCQFGPHCIFGRSSNVKWD